LALPDGSALIRQPGLPKQKDYQHAGVEVQQLADPKPMMPARACTVRRAG
jgi:hypothetical protein